MKVYDRRNLNRLASKYFLKHLCSQIMIRFNYKIKKSVSVYLLTGYIFLSVFNILHFHNFNVAFGHITKIGNQTEKTGQYGHFPGSDYQCMLHTSYSSMHNVSFTDNSSFLSDLITTEEISFVNADSLLRLNILSSSALRAPPTGLS